MSPIIFVPSKEYAKVFNNLALAVKTQRQSRAMTQEQLANLCGVKTPIIGLIERGQGNIGLITLVKIAKALGTTAQQLLSYQSKN